MSETVVDAKTLAAKLRQQVSIDDPTTGKVAPDVVAASSPIWPENPAWTRIRLIAVTEQGNRRLEEYMFTPSDAARPNLPTFAGCDQPVAVVFERAADGRSVARLYAAHQLVEDRKPILEVDAGIHAERSADDILATYFHALHSADVDATLATFAAEGYMQHSNGERHSGSEKLRAAFTKFFKPGPIVLRYCNKTDAGDITALECYMPSGRPAVAVYQRASAEKMLAARLYL
ncbi:MAG: hypothetical protein QM718_02470 [Steroidobacteraceae bacterium]